jgi:threonylcarbamoyladenosine tRNA methylthiotransferase MtaB
MCEAVGFSKIHIFPFSPRRGTPAADMPEQVPAEVKNRRVVELQRLADRLRDRYHAGLRGRRLRVLVEGRLPDRPDVVAGTACRYAVVELPERTHSGLVLARSTLVDVEAGEVVDGRLRGSYVERLSPAAGLC